MSEQLTIPETPQTVDKNEERVDKYTQYVAELWIALVEHEYRTVDVPAIAKEIGIPGTDAYCANRILRKAGFLIKRSKRENRYLMYKLAPSFQNVKPEWLSGAVRLEQIARNLKKKTAKTPEPQTEPTPQPTPERVTAGRFGVFSQGVFDRADSFEEAEQKARYLLDGRAITDSETVLVIQVLAEVKSEVKTQTIRY